MESKEWMSRYNIRDPQIIYVHNLGNMMWYALTQEDKKDKVNGYTVVGELIHSGAIFCSIKVKSDAKRYILLADS